MYDFLRAAPLRLPEGQRFFLYLYDKEGRRRALDESHVVDAEWYLDLLGGFSVATLNYVASLDYPLDIREGDDIEIWVDGVSRWSGEVQTVKPELSSRPQRGVISCRGQLFGALGSIPVNRGIAREMDLAEAASAIYSASVPQLGASLSRFSARFTQTGKTTAGENYAGSSLKEALQSIASRDSSNTISMGCYRDESAALRPHLLLFAPSGERESPDHIFVSPGPQVSALEEEEDGADVYNSLVFIGGDPTYPQLFPNPLFNSPVLSGSGIGNLFANGGFESNGYANGDNSVTFWGLVGASVKDSTGQEGAARTGAFVVEIDHVGENFFHQNLSPDELPTPGKIYSVSGWSRVERDGVNGVFRLRFRWLNASGQELSGGAIDADFTATRTYWDYFFAQTECPPGGMYPRVKVTGISGLSSGGGGVLFDDLGCYANDATYQRGWRAITFGSGASFKNENWDLWDPELQCGSIILETINCPDTDGQDAHLEVIDNEGTVSVRAGQSLRATFEMRRVPGKSAAKMRIGIESRRTNGEWITENNTYKIIHPSDITDDWQTFEAIKALEGDAGSVKAHLNFRGNGAVEIRRPCLRDTNAWLDVKDSGYPVSLHKTPPFLYNRYFIRDGGYYRIFDTKELFASGSGEALSVDRLGRIFAPSPITIKSVTTDAAASEWARDHLAERWKSKTPPIVTLMNHGTERFFPGETFQVMGDDAGKLTDSGAKVIRRVHERWSSGALTVRIMTEKVEKDDAYRLVQLIERRIDAKIRGVAITE